MPKNKDDIKFSVLMLSIPSRLDKYRVLQDKLLDQIGDREDVEVICVIDNKSLHIWEKRNELLRMARGTHIAWLDDDDDVADNYIERLTETIEANPNADVISFNQDCYLDGIHARVFLKMGNPHEAVVPVSDGYSQGFKDTRRPPYHFNVWKRTLAQSEPFRSMYHPTTGQSCEDIEWLSRLYPKVEESVSLDDFLHIYQWSSKETESIVL
jgi:glycosyltransferase involved in cell wall biosynthesis